MLKTGLQIRPFMLTLIFFVAAVLLVFCMTDWPLSFHNKNKKNKIAAIALRDNVSKLEKRGSALFTIPYLKKNYSSFNYLEANNDWVTTREFRPYAEELLKSSDSLDVYILSHGNLFYQWFYGMDSSLRKRIRLVYNTGCENDSQYVCYQRLNVAQYVGHSGARSISPLFYFYFLRRMCSENSIQSCVSKSNIPTEKILSAFISNQDTINGSLGVYHKLNHGKNSK